MSLKEQEMASRLLARREGEGKGAALTPLQMFSYAAWGVGAVVAVVLMQILPGPWAGILLGITMGAALREYAWRSAIRRTWPFTEKITDWTRVEAIARGDEAQSPS